MCVLLGVFHEFPVDPYYEPLAWFMILYMYIYMYIYIYLCVITMFVCILEKEQLFVRI